eukprot:CCRYP_017242-RA/>CCRYP_017242-RA protein AED:0.41 eAED:0.41 QI:0/0/0/1/0/0/5/0/589
MPLALFPDHIRAQYNLDKHAIHGFVYLELRGAIYGLPQAGTLANKLLRKRLAPHGYYEVAHTPGLWRHVTRPISFTLVVDDFGVKYVGQEHAEHLINKTTRCPLTGMENSTVASNSIGITTFALWTSPCLDTSTTSFSVSNIPSLLTTERSIQAISKEIWGGSPRPLPKDASGPLDSAGQKRIQQIVGALLYYARAVDNTILLSLSAIASEQAHPTQLTHQRCQQLLDYCASHPNAIVRFTASDMILNIHSDASYLSETKARGRIAGHFFLGSVPVDDKPITLNGAIYVFCGILKFVVASAAEAELGHSFSTAKRAQFCASYSKNLAIRNHQRLRIVTMRQPLALPIIPSKTKIPLHGNAIFLDRRPGHPPFAGTPARKILPITSLNTLTPGITFQSVRGTSIPKTPLGTTTSETTASTASITNTINITFGTTEAIADSGATAHFLLPNVLINNKHKADHPLSITLPDGEVIQSTHVGNLNLPGLSESATLAHVVPGLAHSSLLSIKQLCDNGCHVIFTKNDCKVYRKAELMLVRKCHPATGLWVVPTNDSSIPTKPPRAFATHATHNAYQTSSKAKPTPIHMDKSHQQ